MSDSNRGDDTAIGLKRWLAPAIIFAIALLGIGGVQHWIYYDDAHSRAAAHSRDADYHIATECRMINAAPECAREIEQARRENQRSEYDLYSQKAMALWTAIMGAMAVIGIALSGVGVYLIWRTWDATRKAADNSQKTYDAYVAIERARITTAIEEARTIGSDILCDIAVSNIGKSSCVVHRFVWAWSETEDWPKMGVFTGPPRHDLIREGESEVLGFVKNSEGMAKPCLHGVIIYQSPLGKEHKTFIGFQFYQQDLIPGLHHRRIPTPEDT